MAWILTHDQKKLAFRLHSRGWRLVDIAREIGCSAPMVGLMVRARRFKTGVADPSSATATSQPLRRLAPHPRAMPSSPGRGEVTAGIRSRCRAVCRSARGATPVRK